MQHQPLLTVAGCEEEEKITISPPSSLYDAHTAAAGRRSSEAGPSRVSALPTPSRLGNRIKKKPAKLAIASHSPGKPNSLHIRDLGPGSRSVPSSPLHTFQSHREQEAPEEARGNLRDTLRGAPRRRPSVPFGLRVANLPSLSIPPGSAVLQEHPPPIWQDPSEHILSGSESSLQHARSVYAAGPVEVLPGLFLGDEFNARDDVSLSKRGITTILNVAKETILPFQNDASSRRLDSLSSASLTRGIEGISFHEHVATPTSSNKPASLLPRTSTKESFFNALSPEPSPVPPTSQGPSLGSLSASGSFYLRDTTSTPNLLTQYDLPTSSEDSMTEDDSASSQASVGSTPPSPVTHLPPFDSMHCYSPANLSTTTPSAKSDQTAATSATSSTISPTINLPHNAIALNIPPSPQSGRLQPLRYIKLPWTHDETDLAGSGPGGFVTGCSIIADAMGIDLSTGQKDRPPQSTGGVLVHCQCGVSRSATLVIAFVMQAAAYGYDFAETQKLTGMHDCYEMIKEMSSSISPNCSLIYQLVEWERYLSRQVLSHGAAVLASGQSRDPSALSAGDGKKWGNEGMNEEDWTKMRMDEERKEREEEEKSRDQRLKDAIQANARTPPIVLSSAHMNAPSGSGLGARRKRFTPSLTLTNSTKESSSLDEQIQPSVVHPNLPGSSLAPQTIDEEMNEGGTMMDPSAQQLSRLLSPALTVTSAANSSSGSTPAGSVILSSATTPMPPGAFGVHAQTAAERRNKHKRTFSRELPSWTRPSVVKTALNSSSKDQEGHTQR